MKLKKWIKALLVSGSVMALVACSTHRHAVGQNGIDEANAAYGAQSAGVGNEAGFNDKAGGAQSLAKRTYYFDYDKDFVHDSDRGAIVANADYLLVHPRAKVMLEGHTDPRGSREYNVGLGERRAKAVAEILASKGVNPAQVRVVSYGAEKLASPGRDEAAYQLDRRVVLVYLER